MISQLGLDFSGLSYCSKTGNFDLYENAKPLEIEIFNWDAKTRVRLWNIGTQRWLQEAFYKRWEDKLGKSRAALCRSSSLSYLHVVSFLARFLPQLLCWILHFLYFD